MKKYLFIIPSLSSGGAERAVVNLSSELVRQGEIVTVVIYFKLPDEYKIDNRVKVINLSGGNEKQYNKLGYFKKIIMLHGILKKENPDFILPFLPQVTIHAALAGFDMHNKIIHTVRNNPALTPENPVKRFLCNKIICYSWKTIVQNEKQKEFFPKKYHNKIFVMFNPVAGELLNAKINNNNDRFTIIGVGRLEKQKNFNLLISAMNKVVEHYPDVILKIYGSGSLKNDLQKQIDDNNLNINVKLMGRNSNMLEVYKNADMFVLSSDFEGMPNTLIEAMAIGLPCISTDCETGPSDLIENEINGLLVPVNDTEALSDAILSIISDKNKALKFSEESKKKIKTVCSADSIVKSLRQICEREN